MSFFLCPCFLLRRSIFRIGVIGNRPGVEKTNQGGRLGTIADNRYFAIHRSMRRPEVMGEAACPILDECPKEVREFMNPAIDDYYRDKDQVQRDEAMRSCGIAAQTLMLAAKSMGYDSCPMDGFDFEYRRYAHIHSRSSAHRKCAKAVVGMCRSASTHFVWHDFGQTFPMRSCSDFHGLST